MSVLSHNPCLACTVNQDCCSRLTGLSLTEKEFQKCFAHHEEKIEVTRDGPLVIINQNRTAPCPNWEGGACSVYEDRPMECRLFPYNSYVASRGTSRVDVRFHPVKSCPFVEELKSDEATATALVEEFCDDVYDEKIEVTVAPENVTERICRGWSKGIEKLQRGWRKFTQRPKAHVPSPQLDQ